MQLPKAIGVLAILSSLVSALSTVDLVPLLGRKGAAILAVVRTGLAAVSRALMDNDDKQSETASTD